MAHFEGITRRAVTCKYILCYLKIMINKKNQFRNALEKTSSHSIFRNRIFYSATYAFEIIIISKIQSGYSVINLML